MANQNRIYLDYNATAPLSSSVKKWLKDDLVLFANPSSVHSQGKKTKRAIQQSSSTFYKTFDLNEKVYNLIYHSGATEGVNSFFKGLTFSLIEQNKNPIFAYSATDHSCVRNMERFFSLFGFETFILPLDSSGVVDTKKSIESLISKNRPVLLNWTWVNNETGLIQDLNLLKEFQELKGQGIFVHVDAVQSIGKIELWNKLAPYFDSITFSGHKFGSLKGVGFSFLKHELPLIPLLSGGGQQKGLRSGTENVHGILSMEKALKDCLEIDVKDSYTLKKIFEDELIEILGSNGVIVLKNEKRNSNTTFFVLKNFDAQTVSMAFDLEGFDISNGSACSSGAVVPSSVLLALGYSEKEAKSAIRVSFSPTMDVSEYNQFKDKFFSIIKRFC